MKSKTMSQDQSPTDIDAIDAELLAPVATPAALTIQQTEQLERCSHHLVRLNKLISGRELHLVYLYVEAGFYLLKAHAIHRVRHGVAREYRAF